MADEVPPAVTRDAFFGGRLILEQPAKGHRAGTDAVLLAAAVPRDFSGHVYDIGAGVGAVGLGIALACLRAEVTLVEKDRASAALARRNVATNGFAARADVVTCDVLSGADRRTSLARKADLVVTNPPFHRQGSVRESPDANRRAAHVFDGDASLADWLLGCLDGLAARGTLIVLHQADAVPEMVGVLAPRLGGLTLITVHPRADRAAVRVLLRGKRGSRAPFRVAPPLVLHDADGVTPESDALHAGTAALAW